MTYCRVAVVSTRASSAIPSWTTLSSAYTYEPFGSVRTVALGNGLAVANDNDASGRLGSRRLYRASDNTSLSHLTYGYDADDNIASITNQLSVSGSALYGYDKTGRLSLTVVDAASLGNETYAYTTSTNRLASVTGSTGTRNVTYDARGNTASETRPGGIAASTTYDGYARLTGYTRTDAGALTFAYNGLDDRVSMTLPASGTRRFVYDASGRVMGEYGASASDVKTEFIWAAPEVGAASAWGGDDGLGGYMPLAVATPDSTGAIVLNWVHGGHLGVPLITTDATGALATTPNDYLAPGFPGQSRVLPDLYYNRYRDYDPATGRYVQADPIGLGGGDNSFLYAEASPLNWIDPEGLQYRLPPRVPRAPRLPLEDEMRRAPIPGGGSRSAPRYRPGEFFIGPPGSTPTPRQIADARGVCIPSGETFWTQYGRQAHRNYRDALGGSFRYDIRLPSGRRPDAVNFENREVRELKPGNSAAMRRGNHQLERYRQRLESLYGGTWTGSLDTYRPPRK